MKARSQKPTEREKVFSSLRKALQGVERVPRPAIDFSQVVAENRLPEDDLWHCFAKNFQSVRGKYVDSVPDLASFIREKGLKKGYCDPRLQERVGDPLRAYFEIEFEYSRLSVDELEFGITVGSGVVAETGSIVLEDGRTSNRLAAIAPWLHVAVVREDAIYRTVRQALVNMGDDPNIIWVTGPSKTGDIEGILVEGVHGPGEQVCFRL